MAKGHPGLPKAAPTIQSKAALLTQLSSIDDDALAWERISALENAFRTRIQAGIDALPSSAGRFDDFKTSPYVLLIQARKTGYTSIREIEGDIVPAKAFSSMETSAGKMIEAVALPVYDWVCVTDSPMHSANSALDGKQQDADSVRAATLKSGPQCLNDGMVKDLANAVLDYVPAWAEDAGVEHVDFTYGVLYGTRKQSNKKDWHILRVIEDEIETRGGRLLESPKGKWDCVIELGGVRASVTVRIGLDWWRYLGGATAALELWVALIRACVTPDNSFRYGIDETYAMSDLADIVSTARVDRDYNVRVLQKSQIPWLFFIARHFCDKLTA
jgi:hypothetical protein